MVSNAAKSPVRHRSTSASSSARLGTAGCVITGGLVALDVAMVTPRCPGHVHGGRFTSRVAGSSSPRSPAVRGEITDSSGADDDAFGFEQRALQRRRPSVAAEPSRRGHDAMAGYVP